MKRLMVSLAVLALLAFAPVASAAPNEATSFTGLWRSIDCASWWEDGHRDCSVWGDGSLQTMRIGVGTTPQVRYEDSFATVCMVNGSPTTRWVASGRGTLDSPFLFVNFTKSGCGTFGTGGYEIQLCCDDSVGILWEDEDGDGWGLFWYRVG